MSAEQYIDYVYLSYLTSSTFDQVVGKEWIPEENMKAHFVDGMRISFKAYGHDIGKKYDSVAQKYYSMIINDGIVPREGDDLTGLYCLLDVQKKDAYLRRLLSGNDVGKRIGKLGRPALERALNNLALIENWEGKEVGHDLVEMTEISSLDRIAPAGDRIVTFSDNEIDELDAQTSRVIDAVEAQNQIGDQPGLRELVVGQLKAGRELLRAGSFKIYFLQLTLIETLQFLAKRYEKEVIGGLAAALITALIKHIGLDA